MHLLIRYFISYRLSPLEVNIALRELALLIHSLFRNSIAIVNYIVGFDAKHVDLHKYLINHLLCMCLKIIKEEESLTDSSVRLSFECILVDLPRLS